MDSLKRNQKLFALLLEAVFIVQIVVFALLNDWGFTVAFILLAILSPIGFRLEWQLRECKKQLKELEER